jgi:hypothetical protein
MARTLALLLLLLACTAPRLPAADFFVAPNGNDAWSGKSAEPNTAGTDGPFASLTRAQQAVRNLKPRQPVTVHLRGGVYHLEKTLEFTPQDSGTRDCPITYAAYRDEKPVISGGRAITGWRKAEGGQWQTVVPGVRQGQWRFHQLFVNGQRRTRARTPNVGFLYTAGITKPFDRAKWYAADIDANKGFRYRDADIREWTNRDDALIVIYHSWTTSIHTITKIDPVERIVRLAPRSAWPIGYWWEYNTRYHVENIPEALDSPGEWYLDRKTGVLRYWPMPGEDMSRAEMVAPVVQQTLVALLGDPAAKKPIEYLRFQGLAFHHADCYIAADMELDHQGAMGQKPLVWAVGLRHTRFDGCELAHAGENGLWLDAGSTDNVVRRCHIHDLGGGAVFLGARKYKDDPELAVLRNTVDNCFLHNGSQIFRGSQGVWIGKASYNQVTHNEISDFLHLGLSVGHSWGYAPTTAHHNLIAFNHIHHIANGYFSDGGGIYTLGISPGTVIRNNVVHDVIPTPLMPDGGCGIYHDEGSTGILVENNVVYNVGIPFHQHYGRENLARNNIFAFERKSPISCARREDHLSYTFEGNIVLSRGGQATSERFSPLKCNTAFRRNLYWDTSGKAPLFGGVSFAQWQATGRDRDSRIADPQFEDAPQFDFRLKPTSPALALGFTPIDVAQAGLYGDREWASKPSKIHREPLAELPPPPPPPPPRPYREDFESLPAGRPPLGFSFSPADPRNLIQVTTEVAAGGRQSLKFLDAAGLKYAWQPHLYFRPGNYTSPRVRFSCDLMQSAQQPSECFLALREWDKQSYREGPSLVLRADGTLAAAGKDLTRLPLGQWIHLDIQLDLGDVGIAQPPKTYRLELTVAGRKPQIFPAVPYLHPQFARLTWIGLSSSGQPGAVFHVDNLRVDQQ